MNILFISHGANRGGSETDMVRLMNALPKDDFSCSAVFPRDGQVVDDARQFGIRTFLVDQKPWMGFNRNNVTKAASMLLNVHRSVRQLEEIITRNSIELVVTNTVMPMEGALAAFTCRVPHIWYVHELLGQDPKLISLFRLQFVYLFILNMSRAVVVVSEAVKNDIYEAIKDPIGMAYPFTPSDVLAKVHVIHNGIRVDSRPPIDRTGNRSVLTVGGVCRRKGQLVLLRAAKIVCAQMPQVTFDVIGRIWERDYYEQIMDEWRRSNLGAQFKMWRKQPDLEPFYQRAALYAMPSECEAFSVVLLEAMAKGMPLVSTDSGGPKEIVIDGQTGLLVPPNDPEKLAEKILYMLTDENAADDMAKRAYDRVRELFTYENKVQKFVEVVKGAVNGHA